MIWTRLEAGVPRPIWKRVAPRYPADQIYYRDPHQEGAYDTLDHNKHSFLAAVIITGKAEKEGGEHTVDGISLQITVSVGNDGRILGKDRGHNVPVEKGQDPHDHAYCKSGQDSVSQGFFGPERIPGPHVLGNESRHRLHIGGRHQHDKGTDFFSHAYSRRSGYTESIYNSLDHQKGDPYQQLLESHRSPQTDFRKDDILIKTDKFPGKFKGKLPLPDNCQRNDHADCRSVLLPV